MGCCWSGEELQTVRCSRCNSSDSALTNNVCQRCIQVLQVSEYTRRLAALRDESTTATSTVYSASSVRTGSFTQSRRFTELPRHSVHTGPPRYVVSKKKTIASGKRSVHQPVGAKPLFGEYKCSACHHFWSSRRSWRGMYQKCQNCGVHVYPHSQRELRKSDMSNPENPHPEHLCEKCIRLGYYCGKYGRSTPNKRTQVL